MQCSGICGGCSSDGELIGEEISSDRKCTANSSHQREHVDGLLVVLGHLHVANLGDMHLIIFSKTRTTFRVRLCYPVHEWLPFSHGHGTQVKPIEQIRRRQVRFRSSRRQPAEWKCSESARTKQTRGLSESFHPPQRAILSSSSRATIRLPYRLITLYVSPLIFLKSSTSSHVYHLVQQHGVDVVFQRKDHLTHEGVASTIGRVW